MPANGDLIFRQMRTTPYPDAETNDFILVDGPLPALRHVRALTEHFGFGIAKQLAKTLSKDRLFYITLSDGAVVNIGSLAIGFCNFYTVEPGAVVIGSVWTADAFRGKGLATRSIRSAVNSMITRNRHTFYIDTQAGNTAMLRSIEKLGFGRPVGTFTSRN